MAEGSQKARKGKGWYGWPASSPPVKVCACVCSGRGHRPLAEAPMCTLPPASHTHLWSQVPSNHTIHGTFQLPWGQSPGKPSDFTDGKAGPGRCSHSARHLAGRRAQVLVAGGRVQQPGLPSSPGGSSARPWCKARGRGHPVTREGQGYLSLAPKMWVT